MPFFYKAGSEFDEMFVGVGSRRVRSLFAAAKKKAPCIVFIDEVDAVGAWVGGVELGGASRLCVWGGGLAREGRPRQRPCMRSGLLPPAAADAGGKRTNWESSGGSRKTLNQLLTEMDGFEENSGVVVMAATNLPEMLDTALTRPGRFDRQVAVPLPDVTGRQQILELYLAGKPLTPDVDAGGCGGGGRCLGGGDGVAVAAAKSCLSQPPRSRHTPAIAAPAPHPLPPASPLPPALHRWCPHCPPLLHSTQTCWRGAPRGSAAPSWPTW